MKAYTDNNGSIDDDLLFRQSGRVLYVTLNRPSLKNALNEKIFSGLEKLVLDLHDNSEVNIVVIRGAGKNFCSGADLKAFNASHDIPKKKLTESEVASSNRRFGKILEEFAHLPQIIISVVEGVAYAGGFGLAAASDLVIADHGSKFSISEPRVGIVPAQILPFVIRRLGSSQAKRMALTGIPVTGDELLSTGLVNFASKENEIVDDIAEHVITQILRSGPNALKYTKKIFERFQDIDLSQLLDEASLLFAKSFLSDEAREGIQAFVEKRVPTWGRG